MAIHSTSAERANSKITFALYFGNRTFFPASLMTSARRELPKAVSDAGFDSIMMEESATRYGAVETPAEGEKYAEFLKRNAGKYDGVILSLPNFGDETGAIKALRDCGTPILIQAYPDELDKMAPALRRDAFCGKCSIMDVFHQSGLAFTALKPHTVSPKSKAFAAQLDHFARVCRVVKKMKNMSVGAVGARTTAFKTVRFDELALQRKGITVETFDLADIFARVRAVSPAGAAYREKAAKMKSYSDWSGVPDQSLDTIVRLGIVLDNLAAECKLQAMALRCWSEMQQQLQISPCVVLSEMNDRGMPVACEVDVGNAVAMYALQQASGDVAACLDWNNNYGDDEDKCILFHCGPVPQRLMAGKGKISDHLIICNAVGKGHSFGCNVGRIAPTPMTFSSMATESGKVKFYLGEGRFTKDPVPKDFFGCAGVAEVPKLQDVLLHVGYEGHRHHTSVTPGHVMAPLKEALERYLGFEVSVPQAD
ncbi:MAG: L-fucose/L-arabinose isomerase family protein [Candidatus Brocadiia bacterium]